jgi:hypothetical protein
MDLNRPQMFHDGRHGTSAYRQDVSAGRQQVDARTIDAATQGTQLSLREKRFDES